MAVHKAPSLWATCLVCGVVYSGTHLLGRITSFRTLVQLKTGFSLAVHHTCNKAVGLWEAKIKTQA